MTDNNQKAIDLLNISSAKAGMLPTSKAAFVQLTNPFADFEHAKSGYPDVMESNTIVLRRPFTQTFTAPSGTATTWDAHVVMTKLTNVLGVDGYEGLNAMSVGAGLGNQVSAAANNLVSIGGCTVMSAPSGNGNLDIYSVTTNSTPNSYMVSIGNQISTVDGARTDTMEKNCRVIGTGFEVRLIRTALTDEGSVIVWQQPETGDSDDITVLNCLGDTIQHPTVMSYQGTKNLVMCKDVPPNPAACLALPGSKQWLAKEGVMMVGKLRSPNVPVSTVRSRTAFFKKQNDWAWTPTGYSGPIDGYLGTAVILQQGATLVGGATVQGETNLHINEFNECGAYFSGIDKASSLCVNYVTYVECVPDQLDTELTLLATPSPPYDPVFLQAYTEAVRHLPAGFKIKDNASGDAFYEAVQWFSKALMPVMTASGGIVGTGLGSALALANEWAGSKLGDKQKQQQAAVHLARPNYAAALKSIPPPPPLPRPRASRVPTFFTDPQGRKAVMMAPPPGVYGKKPRVGVARPPGQGLSKKAVARRNRRS